MAGFVSVKDVAGLRVMQLLVAPMDQVFIALSFLVLPALAARYASNRMGSFLSFTKRYALTVVGATALFALAVRIVGKPVMHLLYAGKFDDLAPTLYILAFLPLVMGIGNTMNAALKAAEKPKLRLLCLRVQRSHNPPGGDSPSDPFRAARRRLRTADSLRPCTQLFSFWAYLPGFTERFENELCQFIG